MSKDRSEYYANYMAENRDKVLAQRAEYRKQNKELINSKNKEYYDRNRERILNRVKEYQSQRKEQRSAYMRKWREKNPEAYKRNSGYFHERHILSTYGLTPEQYQAMLQSQGGRCKICGRTEKTRLAVDHCHKTGKVRGLLCTKCNSALGLFGDNVAIFQSAINYLNDYANNLRT